MSSQSLHNRLVDEFEIATQMRKHDYQVRQLDQLAEFLALWASAMRAAADGDKEACAAQLKAASTLATMSDASGKQPAPPAKGRKIVRCEDLERA